MKLVYLYIDDFHPFKKTELKFVADYDCAFDGAKLSVVMEKKLPEKFFSSKNSGELYVSALVGQNGAGKTSLVRFLEALHFFPIRANKFVLLVEAKGALFVYYNLEGKQLQVRAERCKIASGNVIDILSGKNADGVVVERYLDLRTCFHTVYYSPYYTITSPVNYPSPSDESDAYFTSISTTTKLNQASQRLKGLSLSPDVIFRSEEIRREIRFYREASFDLPQPQRILLRAQDWRLWEIVGCFGEIIQSEKLRRERLASGEANPTLRCSDGELDRMEKMFAFLSSPSDDVFILIFKCLAAIVWYEKAVYRDGNFEKHEVGRLLYDFTMARDGQNRPVQLSKDAIVKTLHQLDFMGVISFDLDLADGDKCVVERPIAEFFSRIKDCPTVSNGDGTWSLNVASIKGSANVVELVDIYERCAAIGDFAQFSFDPPLSAGEQTLLSLYSRIWEMFEERRSIEAGYNGDNFSKAYAGVWESGWLIVLDEAEVALHPDWQRTLVKNLLQTFNTTFPGFNVHFIFATHSPILLSDIPRGNIVFLTCKKQGVDGENRVACETETFAANIFDLYKDSFFLEKGTIGAFAAEKVNALLEKLNSKREDNESNEEYDRRTEIGENDLRVASLIGDPFLSHYVWRRLDELSKDCDAPEDEQSVVAKKE